MYSIDLTHAFTVLNEGLMVLLTGLAGWILWEAKGWIAAHAKFLNADTQQKMADTLNSALNYAIQFAMNQVTAEEAKVHPTTDSKIVQIAANYAANHVGDTLAKMGKSPSDVAEMVLARLPSPTTTEDTTGVVIAPSAAVVVAPLADIPGAKKE